MPLIVVQHVTKSFPARRKKGTGNAIKALFKRDQATAEVLRALSFEVGRKEILGVIGPEAAGKTVLMKILSGILAPSSGNVRVDGLVPSEDRKQNALRIGAVFDKNTHLHWNESFQDILDLYQTIYQIPTSEYLKSRSRLIDLFGLGHVLHKPPALLTSSEKARANIALAALHRPSVLYLDDLAEQSPYTKRILQDGIRAINEEWNTAIMLSTRNMSDIAPLCGRMLLLDEGSLLYDGSYERFVMQYQTELLIAMEFDAPPQWREHALFSLAHVMEGKWIVRVSPEITKKDAFKALLGLYNPRGIALYEQKIDDIVPKIKKDIRAAL